IQLRPWPKAASYPENAKAQTQQCEWWKDSNQPSCLSFVQLSLIFCLEGSHNLITILLKLGNVDIGPLHLHPCSEVSSKLCPASGQIKLFSTPVFVSTFVTSTFQKLSVAFRFNKIDFSSYPKRQKNSQKSKKPPPPRHIQPHRLYQDPLAYLVANLRG